MKHPVLSYSIAFYFNFVMIGTPFNTELIQTHHQPSNTLGVAKLLSMIIIITKTYDSYKFYDAQYWAAYVEVLFS